VWQSTDPAIADYLPSRKQAPKEFQKLEKKLAGQGGVYNAPNMAMYTYVHNNPVVAVDPDGQFLQAAIGGVVGAAVEATAQIASEGEITSWTAVGASAAAGAVTGGASAVLARGAAQGAISARTAVAGTSATSGASSGAASAGTQLVETGQVDLGGTMKSTGAGLLGGYMGGKAVNRTAATVERLIARGGAARNIGEATRSSVFGGKDAGYKVTGSQKAMVEGLNLGLSVFNKETDDASSDP
jgi:hypothetical protein